MQVAVDDAPALAAVREQLAEGEHLPHFSGVTEYSFEAEVNDLELLVCRPGAGGPA